jgi:predicted alpha/beta hydrolase
MGRYDLPAMINYVCEATGSRHVKYMGHSMGSTAFWVMCHYDHAKYGPVAGFGDLSTSTKRYHT